MNRLFSSLKPLYFFFTKNDELCIDNKILNLTINIIIKFILKKKDVGAVNNNTIIYLYKINYFHNTTTDLLLTNFV